MEQRLRLVQGGQQPRGEKRTSERRRLEVPGQIVWKDAGGTTRFASVVTRDVSEHGVAAMPEWHRDSAVSIGVFPD